MLCPAYRITGVDFLSCSQVKLFDKASITARAPDVYKRQVIGKTDYDLFSLEEAEKYRRDDEATVSMRGDFTLREMVHFQGERCV